MKVSLIELMTLVLINLLGTRRRGLSTPGEAITLGNANNRVLVVTQSQPNQQEIIDSMIQSVTDYFGTEPLIINSSGLTSWEFLLQIRGTIRKYKPVFIYFPNNPTPSLLGLLFVIWPWLRLTKQRVVTVLWELNDSKMIFKSLLCASRYGVSLAVCGTREQVVDVCLGRDFGVIANPFFMVSTRDCLDAHHRIPFLNRPYLVYFPLLGYPARARVLRPIIKEAQSVLGAMLLHGEAGDSYIEYKAKLSQSRIAVTTNLESRSIPHKHEVLSRRAFHKIDSLMVRRNLEYMLSGCLLLAQRTPLLSNFFDEGVHFIGFASGEDGAMTLRHLLKRDGEDLRHIAKQGEARARSLVSQGKAWDDVISLFGL